MSYSSPSRHNILASLSGLYKLYTPSYGLDVCFYCGQPADTYDHVPPLVVTYYMWSLGNVRDKKCLLVPCCRECNSILNSCPEDKLLERKKILKKKLTKRYKNKIINPKWTIKELDSLGPDLKRYVELGINLSEYLKRRLAW